VVTHSLSAQPSTRHRTSVQTGRGGLSIFVSNGIAVISDC
jgi:hypothetical protein